MPRTTLQLEADAIKIAKAYAARHRVRLGQAVSALVRRGAKRSIETVERNGFRVRGLDRRSPRVTAAQVDALLD